MLLTQKTMCLKLACPAFSAAQFCKHKMFIPRNAKKKTKQVYCIIHLINSQKRE